MVGNEPAAGTTPETEVRAPQRESRSFRPGIRAARWLVLLALLALWQLGVTAGAVDPYFYSSPREIGQTLVELFGEGRIWEHLVATVQAAVLGLLIGFALGSLLGWLAARYRWVAEFVEPVMTLLNSVPRIVVTPMIILWLGIGLESKIAAAFLLVFVVIFFSVYTGIRQVNRDLVDRVRILGGNERAILRHVYVPSVAAYVFSSLRLTVGFAFTGAIVGEYMASSRGLGYLLNFAQNSQNAALMLSTVVIIMVVIMGIFALLGRVERRAMVWRDEH